MRIDHTDDTDHLSKAGKGWTNHVTVTINVTCKHDPTGRTVMPKHFTPRIDRRRNKKQDVQPQTAVKQVQQAHNKTAQQREHAQLAVYTGTENGTAS